MRKNMPLTAIGLLLLVLLAACSALGPAPEEAEPATPTPTLEPEATGAALPTEPPEPTEPPPTEAPQPPTETPTPTTQPVSTLPPTTAPAVVPCNAAQFVEDVNYPDGTDVLIGTPITKRWRLKNIGTCTWTTDYLLVFDGGDQMGAPDEQQLKDKSVAPGEEVTIAVDMKVPSEKGTYQGYYKIQAADGTIFGIGNPPNASFWVAITAYVDDFVDVRVRSFYFEPESPGLGDPFTVHVVVKNRGNLDAGAFTVGWWKDEDDGSPTCSWDIASLAADAETAISCDDAGYDAAGTYVTYALVDTADVFDEPNEDNNSRSFELDYSD